MKQLHLTLIALLLCVTALAQSPAPITGSASVCVGTSAILTDATPGGTWSSSTTTVATIDMTGTIFGVSAGLSTITYTVGSFYATKVVTVNPAPGVIGGPTHVCLGSTITLTDPSTGGIWASAAPAIASIAPTTGVVTPYYPGVVTIIYTLATTGCNISALITVDSAVSPITGSRNMCAYTDFLYVNDSMSGGIWSSTLVTVYPSGLVNCYYPGPATITYTLPTGCSTSVSFTVDSNAIPYEDSASTTYCGAGKEIWVNYSDPAVTYQLYSFTGGLIGTPLLGTGAPLNFGIQTVADTYIVKGTYTSTTCSSYMNHPIVVGGAGISGHINYTGSAADSLQVWLIQFNPSDSSITALDSVRTCMSGTTPYYEFAGWTSGNFLVKAQLLGQTPGTSGYLPTYGLSSPHWDSATTVVAGGGWTTQDITLLYGTVPSGPGFISGYVVSGAGKGTSGDVPAAGMLIYLEDASGHILTYTYTDAGGNYTFFGLSLTSYIVAPEDYNYRTTPSSVITLTTTTPGASAINFKQHTGSGRITPVDNSHVQPLSTTVGIATYPSPSAGSVNITWNNIATGNISVKITDLAGRAVYKETIVATAASGTTKIDVSNLADGMYFIEAASGKVNCLNKLVIRK